MLRALPAKRYEVATFRKCRVNIDYHVEVDAHYYSVPHSLVRQQVETQVAAIEKSRPAARQVSSIPGDSAF
jgi:hypothetical protein